MDLIIYTYDYIIYKFIRTYVNSFNNNLVIYFILKKHLFFYYYKKIKSLIKKKNFQV